jgi:hypothetical protein
MRAPQGLSKLLQDNAPACVRENTFESYFGRKIAVDASMHIYSFLVREGGGPMRWRAVRRAVCQCTPYVVPKSSRPPCTAQLTAPH